MKCHACEEDARAVCVFCGRAVCLSHAKPHGYHAGYGQKDKPGLLTSGSETAFVVGDATWCGACKPRAVVTY